MGQESEEREGRRQCGGSKGMQKAIKTSIPNKEKQYITGQGPYSNYEWALSTGHLDLTHAQHALSYRMTIIQKLRNPEVD